MIRKIAFIGFGEAAQVFAQGMSRHRPLEISAWDIAFQTEGRGRKLDEAARSLGVMQAGSNAELVAGEHDLLISAVTAASALQAAEETARTIGHGACYLDINSVTPDTKIAIAKVLEERGATFIEAVAMDTVPAHGHAVPILAAGSEAGKIARELNALGMNIEVLEGAIGSAASIKMCRSVFVKGLEAILVECLLAARKAGAEKAVLTSIRATFPGIDWERVATYHLGRVALHGARRADEMDAVSHMLEGMGIEPMMARATARRHRWVSEQVGASLPDSFSEIEDFFRLLRPAGRDG